MKNVRNAKKDVTSNQTVYFTDPGVALIARPLFRYTSILPFLEELGCGEYIDDIPALPDGSALCKFAGQMCYLSLGPKRTKNDRAMEYFENIKKQGHGSVFEHANYSFLFWGVSRSFTHELVRHRAGWAYSQVSQRYVSEEQLRFVCRPEYLEDETLMDTFKDRIDAVVKEYVMLAASLEDSLSADETFSALSKTEKRKVVNQTARSCLPNETEAPIVVTANARAWRHFLEMRGSRHAESEIRRVAIKVLGILQPEDPDLFCDYTIIDGAIATPHRKV